MAKRKSVKKSRKKAKQTLAILSTVKRMFIGACVVMICLIGLLFLYNYFFPFTAKRSITAEQKESEKTTVPAKPKASSTPPKIKKSEPKAQKAEPKASSTKTFRIPSGTEIPKLQAKRKEQIIKHDGYTVSYNADYCIANWVAYELTAEEAKSNKAERSNKFVPDPDVKGATAVNEDYSRTGYDRGHLAPAGDMKWSTKAMRESFYFSNICPQKPRLNRGLWKDLEEQCRLWAKEEGQLLIVTGPLIDEDMKRLGKNRVGIPKAFYKAVCYYKDGKYKGIGFILDNSDNLDLSLQLVATTIKSLERATGIDFFPSLPDQEEKEMETWIDWDSWSF